MSVTIILPSLLHRRRCFLWEPYEHVAMPTVAEASHFNIYGHVEEANGGSRSRNPFRSKNGFSPPETFVLSKYFLPLSVGLGLSIRPSDKIG